MAAFISSARDGAEFRADITHGRRRDLFFTDFRFQTDRGAIKWQRALLPETWLRMTRTLTFTRGR